MGEHQERDSNDVLSENVQRKLEQVYDEYTKLQSAGDSEGAEKLVVKAAGSKLRLAGHHFMAVLRIRKAAAAKGLRIGV